jgi:uncharacterized repeat protein (TIGR02543 family)
MKNYKFFSAMLLFVALAVGQTAQAMVTEPMTFEGYSNTNGNTSLHVWLIRGFLGTASSQPVSGTSQTFNNAQVINSEGNIVTINGTLNFTVTNALTDVYTGSVVTLVFESSHFWFYGATVKTLSDANVTGCSCSISDNHQSITVTIPQGKTFGKVYLDFVPNAPMTNSNTTVTVPAGDYWVSDANHKPMPMPTVTYGNTTLTQGTDYTLSWSNNGSAGYGNVTATGAGNYVGSATGSFYIRWATYTVHFDKNHNDATGTMADQAFTYATSKHLTANAFTRNGYTFSRWCTNPNGTGISYTDGQLVNNITPIDGETVTLYAQWEFTTYNITYDLDGGSVATANPATYNIGTPTFMLNNPTQPCCTFDGWTGTGLNEATQTVTIAQGSTGDRSYTANWTHLAYVLVLENGITATPVPAITYNSTNYYTPGTEITLSYTNVIPTGYEFHGFLVNGSPIEGNTFVMPASDVTVSANLAAIPWEGAGTSDDPYIIIHANQIDMLAIRLNTGTGDDYASSGYNGIYFKLGADINYNPNELTNGENYTAIGSNYGDEDYQFYGTFDGDNHIISGIRINKPNYDLQGLFGAVGSTGTVKNVILDDAVVIGRNCVGGIAGNKLGTIENCRVINTNITGNNLVGGIAGHSANQTIENNMVLNTAITYDNTDIYNYGGAIIGTQQTGSIRDNYYHNCTVNGVTSNIGCGFASIGNIIFGDITENNAAVQAYTLTLSPHITATPAANATYDGILYYTEGTEITLGSKDGYTITSATLIYGGNNYNIEPIGGVYSFTMPAADVSVTVTEISGDRYQLFEGNIVEGDYLIVYNLKGNLCAMNNVISSDLAFQYKVVNAIDNVITTDNADIVWHIAPNSDGNWTIYNAAIEKYAGGRLAQNGAHLYDETDYCATWIVGYSCEFQNRDDRFLGFRTRGTDIIGFDVRDHDPFNPIYTNLSLYKKVVVPTGNYTFNSTTGELTLISGEFNKDNKWGNDVDPSAVTSVTATNQVSFTGDCTDLFRGFESCTSMDLNSVNTANVTNMAGMFHNCSSLQSLDLSGWNTAGVLDMTSMFKNCSSLVTIYVGTAWSTENVTLSSEVFYNCISIVGGNGCPFFSTYSWCWDPGLTYAHIDMPDNPGYLTGRFNKDIAGYQDDESGWYLIASPISTPITLTEGEGILTNDYDLYRFNQSAESEWENWKQTGDHYHFNIESGRGYLYANSKDVKLSFTGVPYSGDGTVTLDKDDNADLSGWNLVGNPFSVEATVGMDFYRMNDDGSGIVPATGNTVNPMEGIFVYSDHSGDYVTFTPNSNNSNSAKGNNSNDASLVINLSKGNRGSAIDRAIVQFDSKNTLPKLQIFDGNTKLYIPQDFEEYAIVSSNRQGEMPLNFKAKETGMYTISFEGIDLNNIKLIDILDGKEIDLSETSSYTFIGSPADRQARFKIIFEGSENSDSSEISNFAYQSGTDIIVNGEGELQVFDLMGRMVMQKRIDGVETLREMSHATGVYILKLNEKTQKIVIR